MPDKRAGIDRWECPNCGQTYFGDDPPDMCDFCGDFTTWRPLNGPAQKAPPRSSSRPKPPTVGTRHAASDDRAHQPPLFDDPTGN